MGVSKRGFLDVRRKQTKRKRWLTEKKTENTETLLGTETWNKTWKTLFLYCGNAPRRGGQPINSPGGPPVDSLKAKTWPYIIWYYIIYLFIFDHWRTRKEKWLWSWRRTIKKEHLDGMQHPQQKRLHERLGSCWNSLQTTQARTKHFGDWGTHSQKPHTHTHVPHQPSRRSPFFTWYVLTYYKHTTTWDCGAGGGPHKRLRSCWNTLQATLPHFDEMQQKGSAEHIRQNTDHTAGGEPQTNKQWTNICWYVSGCTLTNNKKPSWDVTTTATHTHTRLMTCWGTLQATQISHWWHATATPTHTHTHTHVRAWGAAGAPDELAGGLPQPMNKHLL